MPDLVHPYFLSYSTLLFDQVCWFLVCWVLFIVLCFRFGAAKNRLLEVDSPFFQWFPEKKFGSLGKFRMEMEVTPRMFAPPPPTC